jgi:hypothetical protein
MNPLPAVEIKEVTGGEIEPDGTFVYLETTTDSGPLRLKVAYPAVFGLIINLQQGKLRAAKRQGEARHFSDVNFLRLDRATGQTVAGSELLLRMFDEHQVDVPFLLSRKHAQELKNSLDKWLSTNDPKASFGQPH